MAYHKLLSPAEIIETTVQLLEEGHGNVISLRGVAAALGVKAPSLYRYFPQKQALELAVADAALRIMLSELQRAAAPDPEQRFVKTAKAYLSFARKRSTLYVFIMERIPETYGSDVGKAVWNLLLEAAGGVSGNGDDTAAAVAIWSFLHGYAILGQSGGFGASGPKGGLEWAIGAFLAKLRQSSALVTTTK